MSFTKGHVPVLLDDFLYYFSIVSETAKNKGLNYFFDFTFGLGGHSLAILKNYDWVNIVAFDADPSACTMAAENYRDYIESGRLKIINSNFVEFGRHVETQTIKKAFAALADFGISSHQLSVEKRGFSFDDRSSLDMRIDPNATSIDAKNVVNSFSEEEIADILFRLGDERLSRPIAHEIAARRSEKSIESSFELAEIVRKVYKRHPRIKMDIDFATKSFMALRIFVNNELDAIASLLRNVKSSFNGGAWLFAISFHSNEDRIVKDFITEESCGCICPKQLPCVCNHKPAIKSIVRKPVCAKDAEMRENPRSRSAKMRIFELL